MEGSTRYETTLLQFMVPYSLASEKLEGNGNFEYFEIDVLVESNFTLLGLFRLINCWSKDYITLKFIVQIKIVRISLNHRSRELSYVFSVLPPLFRQVFFLIFFLICDTSVTIFCLQINSVGNFHKEKIKVQ